MGELIDFDKARTKRGIKEIAARKGIVYEIYLTVVKYVFKYADKKNENPYDFLTTEAKLEEIYKGDVHRFDKSLREILAYWELEPSVWQKESFSDVFYGFRTIGDVCLFIERKLKEEKKS